jgi:hypothetical protein
MAISYHTQKQASLFKLLQKGNERAAVGSPFIPLKMIIIIVNGIVYFLAVPEIGLTLVAGQEVVCQ